MSASAASSLGGRLRSYRRRAGLTQEEVATLARVSLAAVRDVEQGRVAAPRAATLRQLGMALGLTTGELAGLAEARPVPRRPAGAAWIGVLGPLVVQVEGIEVDPGSELQRVLLGLLALSPNQPIARERLLARLSAAGRPPTTGALAARMSRLRRRLLPQAIVDTNRPEVVAVDGGYELRVAEGQLDLLDFQALVRQARRHHAAGELPQAWQRYARAVRLWRGEPLSGLAMLADDPAVVGLVRRWPAVAVEFATVGTELGRHDEVVPVLRRVVAMDPLHEAAHARLMIALAGTGRQVEALDIFDALRRRLDRDLAAGPGPELVRAHRQVLREEVAAPPAYALRAYRTLPADLVGFTGREPQLRWLRARAGERPPGAAAVGDPALAGGESAAVVIAIEGAAGVGKSRLAIHLAHQLVATGRFPAQQLYADLSGPADPAEVLASLLRLLGIPGSRLPAGLPERAALYRDRLRAGPALVLLDQAADPAQVMPLLPDGSASLTLVTGRGPLCLAGAHRLRLGPFTLAEALGALAAAAGPDRVAAEPGAAGLLVEAAGRLPLLIGWIAARLQTRPVWTLEGAAGRLAGTLGGLRGRLDRTPQPAGLADLPGPAGLPGLVGLDQVGDDVGHAGRGPQEAR